MCFRIVPSHRLKYSETPITEFTLKGLLSAVIFCLSLRLGLCLFAVIFIYLRNILRGIDLVLDYVYFLLHWIFICYDFFTIFFIIIIYLWRLVCFVYMRIHDCLLFNFYLVFLWMIIWTLVRNFRFGILTETLRTTWLMRSGRAFLSRLIQQGLQASWNGIGSRFSSDGIHVALLVLRPSVGDRLRELLLP